MGGKRRAPPSGSAKGKAAAIGDGAVAQGGAARNISAERTRVAPSEDTLHRVLSFLLDHVGPVPLLELEGATLCSQVCKMWRRELEARGFCSRTVQLCSALAESGNAERLWQIAQRRVDACPRHAKAAFHRDATGFLDNVLEWEGSLHECLQAASQEPDASLLSRGAASTAECLGLLLVRWVGKPPGGDADEASGHSGGLGGVPSVAVSSDGKRVVSGSDDQLVKIWDVETGAEMLSLGGHTGEGICLCTVDENGDLELDAETGETIVHPGCPVPGHSCEVFSVAFSSDGTRVVSGSVDGLVKIWDAATGAEVSSFVRVRCGLWCAGGVLPMLRARFALEEVA
ncbi:quinon protein alcohol dehydrogenase-like superfamily [Baffinella frigidus]|nr:quinon protein alcohol dehydrogenase-like superfamily [Cryptophyta sp. CCMP2293]